MGLCKKHWKRKYSSHSHEIKACQLCCVPQHIRPRREEGKVTWRCRVYGVCCDHLLGSETVLLPKWHVWAAGIISLRCSKVQTVPISLVMDTGAHMWTNECIWLSPEAKEPDLHELLFLIRGYSGPQGFGPTCAYSTLGSQNAKTTAFG